ncbi:MAG: hypothetical protein CL886_04110 [Dehalococcoidia bacterium]|nr:hypothetical protein [Dehalococcoidia bacterium]
MTIVKLIDLLLPMTGIHLVISFCIAMIFIGAIAAYFQVDWVPTGTGKHPFGCYLSILGLGGLIISILIILMF